MIEIKNGKIVTPSEVIEGKSLFIEDGYIHHIGEYDGSAEKVIDAQGRYVMPGFIDVHSDKIEKVINPRPTAVFDFELGLKDSVPTYQVFFDDKEVILSCGKDN